MNDIRKKKTKGIYTTEHDDGLLQTKRKKCIHQRKHTTKRTINRRDNKMLNIRRYEDNWRVSVSNETWECKDRKELDNVVKTLLDLKTKHGELNKKQGKEGF